jgi:polyhydroxyalkanoate synthesis regulator phasin
MATTKTRAKSQKDFVGRLADAGEEALQKLTELPGGQRVASAMNDLRNRVDDLSKKVRGIEELETRVAKLEREIAALKKGATTPRKSTRKPST